MYQALRATSETLEKFLDHQLALRGLPSPAVSLATPTEMNQAGTSGLSVWLYRVVPDENRLNDPVLRPDPLRERTAPPLPTRLHYLITPLGLSCEVEQELLGVVLQSFHDHPRLAGTDLAGAFVGTANVLSVRLEPLSLEEITRTWEALASPFRLSLSYEVSVVSIDSAVLTTGSPETTVIADADIIVGVQDDVA